jgi:RNA polymerase sigma factor (TIGR02999 family)
MGEVTHILSALERGEAGAARDLFPIVYNELRRLAASKLAAERPGQTLQATALVHEAYLRLVDAEGVQQFTSRGHFFAAAAEAMRRILVDAARRKRRSKRGGQWDRVTLADVEAATPPDPVDLLALDEALTRFAVEEPVKADLIKLRYFAGLSLEEAAEMLGISRTTASRYWTYARTWLFSELGGDGREKK